MATRKKAAPQLYLASNSPRRKSLLALSGWKYNTLNAQVDETPLPGEDGISYVRRLAKSKAETAAGQLDAEGVIIAADTTVVDHHPGGKTALLGKPGDQDEARKMLRGLRGHVHLVHTAISIRSSREGTEITDLCTTHVPMRNYTDQEIDDYVASGDPMDKAGAYAIQHTGFHPVDKMEGCFANVMGLPLCHLVRSLSKIGILPGVDVPQACQTELEYHCPVYPQILGESIQDYTWKA